MTPELLLERFGYLAVFVGTFLEGETILVFAGFFAERGYLLFPLVALTAFAGAYSGHVFWFWVGRTKGLKTVRKHPKIEKHLGKGIRLFERWGAPAIFISQYLYGLRISCAIIVGLSKISVAKFLLYQAISCITWAVLITALGYYFGRAVEKVLGRAQHVEKYALFGLIAIAVIVFIWHRIKERKEDELAG